MGEQPQEVWTEELQRTGRVVFPLRRRPVLIQLAVVVLLLGGQQVSSILAVQHADGAERIFRLIGVAGVFFVVGVFVWQLITQRPILTVDHEGIRLGRKRFMPWSDVGTIGFPTGPRFSMVVPVLPHDIWAKDLRVAQANVQNIPAFAAWLVEVLSKRRGAERGAPDVG
jgi:hypothetical protein